MDKEANLSPIVGATLAVAQKGQVQDRSAELTTKPAPTFMQITRNLRFSNPASRDKPVLSLTKEMSRLSSFYAVVSPPDPSTALSTGLLAGVTVNEQATSKTRRLPIGGIRNLLGIGTKVTS